MHSEGATVEDTTFLFSQTTKPKQHKAWACRGKASLLKTYLVVPIYKALAYFQNRTMAELSPPPFLTYFPQTLTFGILCFNKSRPQKKQKGLDFFREGSEFSQQA